MKDARAEREQAYAALLELHREIDAAASALAGRHAARIHCRRGCSACCLDGLRVWPIEAERIRRHHAELLRTGEPHPPGACAFLDGEGACRVYADRPSVCRSQGLPLRVLFEDASGEIAERRDICPLNLEGGAPLDQLAEEDCWLVGPYELRLAALEARFSGSGEQDEARGDAARVELRSLFAARRAARPGRSRPPTPR